MAHRWFPLQKLPSAKGCCGAPCYGSFPSNHQATQVFKAPSPTPPLPQLEIIVYEHLSTWVTCCNRIKVQQILLPHPPSVTSLEFFSWECSPRNFLHTNLCSVCLQGTRSKTEQTSVVLIKKMKGWISSLLKTLPLLSGSMDFGILWQFLQLFENTRKWIWQTLHFSNPSRTHHRN